VNGSRLKDRQGWERRRNCDPHIEQKADLSLNPFFSAFLNAPATHPNLDFVAIAAAVPRERRQEF